ncbi:MAG: hypothetical protein KKE62_06380 [Proteobacteria bacterium]|nr:hypothetical protein [Pseudomonadota bacterium]MBU1542456.1 hypothetical protein [Pseudomonadota bacterium]
MLKLSETDTLKRFAIPPGDSPSGSISVFPSSPLDFPAETFVNSLNRREQNRKTLLKWIQDNLQPRIHYGRVHLDEWCKYARAGIPDRCSNFSHWSRPMLFKGGAELIINVLGLTACYPNLYQYELACVHKQEISRVILKCELKANNGTVVAEGSSARNIRDEGSNLNKAIKMAAKSAMIDATIQVSGLTGVFIKTHQHTLKNNLPDIANCPDNLTLQRNRNGNDFSKIQQDKPITSRQKDLIQRIAGRKGMITENLKRLIHDRFNKTLDNLTRVEASKFIQHING